MRCIMHEESLESGLESKVQVPGREVGPIATSLQCASRQSGRVRP